MRTTNLYGAFALAAAAILAPGPAALANTIYLACGGSANPSLAIDLNNNTVNGKPASVTPLAIDWTYETTTDVGNGWSVRTTQTFHLDRSTGVLTSLGTTHPTGPDGQSEPDNTAANAPQACTVVPSPSTKF